MTLKQLAQFWLVAWVITALLERFLFSGHDFWHLLMGTTAMMGFIAMWQAIYLLGRRN